MVWDGNVMIPLPRFKRLCDSQFAINEEYPLMIVENRSMASHNHYFAALHEAYQNLAEEYAQEFVNEDHLRSWCLCKAGFCTTDVHVFDTPGDAKKFRMAFKRNMPMAIIKVEGNIVTIYEPESQSMAAMKKERFEASKTAVLDIAATMARTTPAELKKNAGRSA
jgi:hypothetical protein